METVTYMLRVEAGRDMVSIMVGSRCHIHSMNGNQQQHGQSDGGQ